jgi:hypothetical protein
MNWLDCSVAIAFLRSLSVSVDSILTGNGVDSPSTRQNRDSSRLLVEQFQWCEGMMRMKVANDKWMRPFWQKEIGQLWGGIKGWRLRMTRARTPTTVHGPWQYFPLSPITTSCNFTMYPRYLRALWQAAAKTFSLHWWHIRAQVVVKFDGPKIEPTCVSMCMSHDVYRIGTPFNFLGQWTVQVYSAPACSYFCTPLPALSYQAGS